VASHIEAIDMGDGPLTKQMLDELTVEWRRWRAEVGAPVDAPTAAKSLPPSAALSSRDIGLVQGVAAVIHELEKQIVGLQSRIEELERTQKTYLGVWKDGKEYTPQSEVTYDGARWICHKRTRDRPGASADWTLMEKATANPRSNDLTTSHPRNGSAGGLANPRLR
jgi:hypothetical protein